MGRGGRRVNDVGRVVGGGRGVVVGRGEGVVVGGPDGPNAGDEEAAHLLEDRGGLGGAEREKEGGKGLALVGEPEAGPDV